MKETYRLKGPFLIGYILLIGVGLLLTIWKWLSVFNPDIVIINADIHEHVSNFSLSLMVYLLVGTLFVLGGLRFRFIMGLGVLLIAGNFVCETVVNWMNTPDLIDAFYGAGGTLISFLYLSLSYKYGRIPNQAQQCQKANGVLS